MSNYVVYVILYDFMWNYVTLCDFMWSHKNYAIMWGLSNYVTECHQIIYRALLNTYIKACFTDYIRCQCESIFTVRELRESRPVPHLKFLIPLPPVPAGFPWISRDSRNAGLPFGALLQNSTKIQSLIKVTRLLVQYVS